MSRVVSCLLKLQGVQTRTTHPEAQPDRLASPLGQISITLPRDDMLKRVATEGVAVIERITLSRIGIAVEVQIFIAHINNRVDIRIRVDDFLSDVVGVLVDPPRSRCNVWSRRRACSVTRVFMDNSVNASNC